MLLNSAHRIGPLCACRMVSKLNDIPFHSVNSPFCEHVNNRRPSGMNITLFTLVLILLLLTCTNFVANDVAGRCGYATGGMKSSSAPGRGRGWEEFHGSFAYTRSSTYRTVVAV